MTNVVISGIGFVHPRGIGSGAADLDWTMKLHPQKMSLGGGKQLHHYQTERLNEHPLYPDRKKVRNMRPDAVLAYIAAVLAIENAAATEMDHCETGLFCAAGQCYGDMWPFIKKGLDASTSNDTFHIDRFGTSGHQRMYPFFSIRALSALPMALIAERFGIQGENEVISSFGAESVGVIQQAIRAISSGTMSMAVVGGFDYLGNPHEIENMYFNDFYEGDFYGASSACFIVLENESTNKRRNGPCFGRLETAVLRHETVGINNQIHWQKNPWENLCGHHDFKEVQHAVVTPTGTQGNYQQEAEASRALFPNAKFLNFSQPHKTVLAAAEPFGTALLAMVMPGGNCGISLSRSVCGALGAVVVTRLEGGSYHA